MRHHVNITWDPFRSWQISLPYWLRYTPGDFQQTTGGKIWRRAERRVPFSKAFQLNLGKNKCTSWTFPRRPPGWAIGLAESLASTFYFTPPPGAGGQTHLSDSYLTSKLHTQVPRICCYRLIFHIHESHAFKEASFSKIYSSLFESQYFKKKMFLNKLCKFIQYMRNFNRF